MNLTKEFILNHPLFPLLTIVYHKCELATIAPYPLDSLNEDIIEYIKQLNKEQLQYSSSNDEIDHFMVQAIQILRFHLLEMAKVHELCDNFCQRYINLLKDKMRFIDILADDSQSDEEEDESLITSEDIKPICSSPHHIQTIYDEMNENFERDTYEEEEEERTPRRQKKRGIFPKSATSLMRAWLFQHLSHPYPSEDEKKFLAQETNLNISQVNNWFINARRRIVQPMIDQSNRAAMMGSEYSDFLTNKSYCTIDPNQISYRLPTNMFDDMTTSTSTYYSSLIHSNSYFPTTNTTDLHSTYGILPAPYTGRENEN